MTARALRRISFWIGIVAAAAMLAVPLVDAWLHPPRAMRMEEGALGPAVFVFDVLGMIGDGIGKLLWVMGFVAVAVAASLVAFGSAWHAGESRRTKLLCWLPTLLVGIAYGALVAVGA